MELTTTLNQIKKHDPCAEGWKKLLKSLGEKSSDNEPLLLLDILESNGIEDALWCLRCWPQYSKDWRLLAVKYAREVRHLMTDQRSIDALDVAERYGLGQASDEELAAARAAARAAAGDAAGDAAGAAAGAAAGDIQRKLLIETVKNM